MTAWNSDPPWVDVADYGQAIGDAGSVVRNNANAAGMQTPVPTCPGWTVLDLVIHLGVVQRWATSIVSGADPGDAAHRVAADEAQGRAAADPLDWLDDGQVDLLNALAAAPPDLSAFFFLKNAPPARRAWARRQAHEATIHAVDAMAARLGAAPSSDQTWIGPRLATDGIDELLTGFVTRRSSALRSDLGLTVRVAAEDTGWAWTLELSTQPALATRHRVGEDHGAADVALSGAAVPLYLALWNRGDDLTVTARPGLEDYLDSWRRQVRISWR